MSDTTNEDFYCDNCHGEFNVLINPDITTIADVQYCVLCGEKLDKDLSLTEDCYEEGWDNY